MVFFSLLSYTTIFDAIRHLTQRPQSAPFRENFIQNALFRTARVAECAFP